jgi:hypothetical protein
MNIIFFEDEYTKPLNIRFRLEILEELPDLILEYVSTVEFFEDRLSKKRFEIFIIDIMTTETTITSNKNGNRIERSLVGIELLERLRDGQYQLQSKNAMTIIRSARATEPDIRRMCLNRGANYIMTPGADDHEIIKIMRLFVEADKFKSEDNEKA